VIKVYLSLERLAHEGFVKDLHQTYPIHVAHKDDTKLCYDLTFPSTTYYTVQHDKVIQREDMKRSALPIPLEVMPQNLQPVVVLAHCKATATEVAKKEITVKTIINVIIKF